jgi:hypothetical protein
MGENTTHSVALVSVIAYIVGSSLIIDGFDVRVRLASVSCSTQTKTPFLALRLTRTQDWGFFIDLL